MLASLPRGEGADALASPFVLASLDRLRHITYCWVLDGALVPGAQKVGRQHQTSITKSLQNPPRRNSLGTSV